VLTGALIALFWAIIALIGALSGIGFCIAVGGGK
jgi:hypothetical protein